MRQREEDQRENRGFRTRSPIRDRGRRFIERSPERRTSRESRDRQERKQVEERVEARREAEARESRTWSNGYHRRFLPRTYTDKDRDYRGKKPNESKPEQVEESKMKKIERSTDSSSLSESEEEESGEDDMNLAREILKLAKKKQKEKTKNRRAIRKAKKARKVRKSLSGDIARTNDSVTGYNSGELYEQETTIQPVKEDKKVSAIQPVKEEKKMPKVFRKVSTSGEKEKQVTEKPMAVIPPQVIKTPEPPAPEVIELEDNQSQAIEDTEDVPQIIEEIRGIQ